MRVKSGFVLEKVGGEYLAVAVGKRAKEFSGFIRLNSTGAYFWNLLVENDLTVDGLVEAALRDFEGVSREEVLPGIEALITNLREGGIIEE